ncbi:MAG TPA: amino acid permease [Gemmatimonadaceae bacterium]|nr:amino acid permease [Gemmatimonadaceae bacterium]
MSLLSKKSVAVLQAEASAEGQHTLKRSLGALNLTLLGIGAIIGAGIFVLTGQAAAQHAGPAIVVSFVLAALGCLFAGLCYAEFAAMIPIAGSAYTYGYATMGELVAWIIGWDLILEYLFAASTVAVGWAGYFTQLLNGIGIHIPERFANAPYRVEGTHTLIPTGAVVNLPAVILVLLLTGMLVLGIKESARLNNIIVFIKIAIVFAVIGFGFMFVNPDNWHPFIPEPTGLPGQFGWSGVVTGASVIFFAYIGFDAVSTAAQETKNPQRDLPIGILASLAICTVLYILMSLVMTGLAPFGTLNVAEPVYVALDAAGPSLAWLKWAATVGAVAGLASVVLVMLMGQPRIFYAMSRDGLLPPLFGKVHPKFQTPWLATLVTGLVAATVAGLFPIDLLGHLVSIGTLLAFVIVCGGVLVLRYTSPELPRPFRTPFVPLVPILGIITCGYLMISLPVDTWLRLVIWMAIGLAIYFLYGRRHSRIGRADAAEAMAAD